MAEAQSHNPDSGFEEDRAPVIPGVKLTHQLSRGPLATVYAGARLTDQRPVAVKVLHSDAPQAARQRFREGCALQGKLNHPNILGMLVDGSSETPAYAISELMEGGDLLDLLSRGLSLQALFKHIKDIARALGVLHELGYVHGDVKPENILFDNAGNAMLADFDTIRETHSSLSPPPGETRASPEYAAPELFAGRAVDGRADLYSLGVVLYRMLVGSVPFSSSSIAELKRKHQQESVPRLPPHLAALQPVIEALLAKSPEQRPADATVLVTRLDEVRRDSRLPVPTLRAGSIATSEIVALTGSSLLTTGSDRSRLDKHRSRSLQLKRLRRTALLALILFAVGTAGYYGWQRELVDPEQLMMQLGIGDDPRVTAAWNDAQSLRRDPNQALAAIAAAYRRVLGLAPQHEAAQEELANLASDWKRSIDLALLERNTELAETRLAEARDVFPTDLDWLQLNQRLDDLQRAERIIASTRRLLASNGLSDVPSATAAIQSYQEVLRLAPGHPDAETALTELGAHYAAMASQAVQRGEVDDAISLLERASAADRTLPLLDDVRTLISRATTTRAAIEELLQTARRLRAQGILFASPGNAEEDADSATKLYHRVLALDPDNVIARQGLVEITSLVAQQVDELLAAGRLTEVDELLRLAATEGLVEEGVDEMRQRLAAERARLETVIASLAAARAFMADGYLTAPPEQNAVAKLREVQQVDPGNVEAEQLLRACADRLATVAEEAHDAELFDEAKQYLDLALAIVPDVPEWVALRDSWEAPGE